VAFADVHGDLAATRSALRLAGAVDDSDHWVGGDLVLVQTGDQLDRGDDEQEILELFERLVADAKAAGGAFHVLNGNHEIMNVAGDLRYVTPAGFADFDHVELGTLAPKLAKVPKAKRSRVAAFVPGGPYARLLGNRNTIVIVGKNVFAHAGVRPEHVDMGIELINQRVRAWMYGGKDRGIVELISSRDSPVWTRVYATPPVDCDLLERTLTALKVARMVVGHTPQKQGISSACDGRVWRIDTGMAAHYGGSVEVLEIEGDRVRVLHTTTR
jgi:hypothetical protein